MAATASNYSCIPKALTKFGLRQPASYYSDHGGGVIRVRMQVSVKACSDHPNTNNHFSLRKSEQAFTHSLELMPGGVNSPVRAFKSVGGRPIVMDSVKGSRMWDIDGNEYIDYVGSWGPAIIGHAHEKVLAALTETMKKGTSFGAMSSKIGSRSYNQTL